MLGISLGSTDDELYWRELCLTFVFTDPSGRKERERKMRPNPKHSDGRSALTD